MHLATGESLTHKQIKASTINDYLFTVAKFLGRFSDRDVRKPDQVSPALAPCIKAVLTELKRWENMPNRREPFTPEMWAYIQDTLRPTATEDSLVAACTDWFTCGLFAGLRLGEWAQDEAHRLLHNPDYNIRGDPRAFCLDDFSFRGPGNILMTLEEAHEAKIADIERVIITFRMQKNANNGETRTYIVNPGKKLCFIRAAHSILRRFIRLVGWTTNIPLAVYLPTNAPVQFVSSRGIEYIMRLAASGVYKLDPQKQPELLQKWSAHSLRVGACVILYAQGYAASQIQFLLRWKSFAFMDYLRNLAVLSKQQNMAMNEAVDMPNFL
jgi:hypothetical protein